MNRRLTFISLAVTACIAGGCKSTPTDTTPTGTPPNDNNHIIPLAVGNQWTYIDSMGVAVPYIATLAEMGAPSQILSADYRSAHYDLGGSISGLFPFFLDQSAYYFTAYGGRVRWGMVDDPKNNHSPIFFWNDIADHPQAGDTIFISDRGLGRYTKDTTITVPAGTFTSNRYDIGPEVTGYSYRVYYAFGVGMVQLSILTSPGHETGIYRLSSYTLSK